MPKTGSLSSLRCGSQSLPIEFLGLLSSLSADALYSESLLPMLSPCGTMHIIVGILSTDCRASFVMFCSIILSDVCWSSWRLFSLEILGVGACQSCKIKRTCIAISQNHLLCICRMQFFSGVIVSSWLMHVVKLVANSGGQKNEEKKEMKNKKKLRITEERFF